VPWWGWLIVAGAGAFVLCWLSVVGAIIWMSKSLRD